MNSTSIEWTDKTWNPITGCTKVSQGCKNCYAETFYERFNGKGSFRNVTCHEDRLLQPLKWKKPSMVFVNSMSDLFHEDVPFSFVDKVFASMALCYDHTFQILTKRPERMVEYFSRDNLKARLMTELDLIGEENDHLFDKCCRVACLIPMTKGPVLKNVWLGVSVEDQKAADERIPLLMQVPAFVRFLSCEPLIGPVDISNYLPAQGKGRINWVIVGGESGPKARHMHPDWARDLRDQCQAAGIAFFFKQWGSLVPVQEHVPGAKYPDGSEVPYEHNAVTYKRIGKKAAGRLLDGQLHDAYPFCCAPAVKESQ